MGEAMGEMTGMDAGAMDKLGMAKWQHKQD
jgi:hypothetical protein